MPTQYRRQKTPRNVKLARRKKLRIAPKIYFLNMENGGIRSFTEGTKIAPGLLKKLVRLEEKDLIALAQGTKKL